MTPSPAPDLSAAERDAVARFDAAPTRTRVANAIHDALCGQCNPDLHRGVFTREDAERAAEAALRAMETP